MYGGEEFYDSHGRDFKHHLIRGEQSTPGHEFTYNHGAVNFKILDQRTNIQSDIDERKGLLEGNAVGVIQQNNKGDLYYYEDGTELEQMSYDE